MDLLFTFDNNYTQHAGVTINSFLVNNPGEHTIYIITDYISDENLSLLSDVCRDSGSRIIIKHVNEQTAKRFPVGEGTINPDLTIATYFRLFATEVIPADVEKILYLDCDMIIDDSLQPLWDSEFQEGKCIIGLEELPTLAAEGCRRLQYPVESSYFNAGVLLINLKLMRTVYKLDDAIQFTLTHTIRYHDQDVLNGLLRDRKQFMDLRYNVMDTYLIRGMVFPPRYQNQREAIFHPAIIHYTGDVKPWHKESRNPYTYKYYEYLQQTPWKGYKPQFKHRTLKAMTTYLAKHSAKYLLDLLGVRKYRYINLQKLRTL